MNHMSEITVRLYLPDKLHCIHLRLVNPLSKITQELNQNACYDM